VAAASVDAVTQATREARPSITAFFPCYNDAGTIASVVIVADRTLCTLADDYEIIVGNDASTDNSADILSELQRHYPALRVLQHPANRGYGGNLRSMFAEATKDLIFYTDGDAQYDPAELAKLYANLAPDVDVVQGWKIERHDPLHRKIIGRVYHHFVRWWFGLHLKDVDCGFRIREVPVHHYHRAYGGSQFFNFSRVGRTLWELSTLWIKLKLLRGRGRYSSGSATPPRLGA